MASAFTKPGSTRARPSCFGETNEATCWPNASESRSMLQQDQERSIRERKKRRSDRPILKQLPSIKCLSSFGGMGRLWGLMRWLNTGNIYNARKTETIASERHHQTMSKRNFVNFLMFSVTNLTNVQCYNFTNVQCY